MILIPMVCHRIKKKFFSSTFFLPFFYFSTLSLIYVTTSCLPLWWGIQLTLIQEGYFNSTMGLLSNVSSPIASQGVKIDFGIPSATGIGDALSLEFPIPTTLCLVETGPYLRLHIFSRLKKSRYGSRIEIQDGLQSLEYYRIHLRSILHRMDFFYLPTFISFLNNIQFQ